MDFTLYHHHQYVVSVPPNITSAPFKADEQDKKENNYYFVINYYK